MAGDPLVNGGKGTKKKRPRPSTTQPLPAELTQALRQQVKGSHRTLCTFLSSQPAAGA